MKDAYYFSHDSNARNDTKILSMRCDYGLEGYGMYWIIVETLRDETNFTLELSSHTYRALAMQMHNTPDAIETFIKDCIKEYHLFKSDDTHFWAESLLRRMGKVEEIRQKRINAANKRWGNIANDKQEQSKSNASALQDYTKERKGKEKKRNNIEYMDIFEHWLLKDIINHKELSTNIIKAIDKALKEYSVEEIKNGIDNYANAYHSDFYFSYKFTLEKFLKQSNGIPDWIEEGSMYENYIDFKNKKKIKSINPVVGLIDYESPLGEREEPW